MFWGLIMEPNKRYTQVVEKAFHISQAAMDISTGDNDPCQVMVVVDGKNFLVCTLQKNKTIQVPIDLYFRAGDSVSFLTNGKCNVHLTGYLDPDLEDEMEEEEDEDDEEEEEAPKLAPTKNKRKLDTSDDGAASKKSKPDKKKGKKAAAEDSDDSDKDQLRKFLEAEEVDTDDNDESFKINASAEADSDEEEDSEEEDDEEEEDDDDDEDEEEDEEVEQNGAKEESSEEADTTMETSKEDSQLDLSKLSKNQRRRLKKQQKKQQETQQVQVNGIDKSKKEKPNQQKADKKEVKDQQAVEKKEKKTLSGGVSVEDLKVGSGAPAKIGKVVQVYYEGRLQTNNKMFDNCLKGPGFKFRLGSKEVIAGWDVGVAGMKVGGKRKIVCPPSMAYGAKGSPPVIPPNSTLVFEVELKNVK